MKTKQPWKHKNETRTTVCFAAQQASKIKTKGSGSNILDHVSVTDCFGKTQKTTKHSVMAIRVLASLRIASFVTFGFAFNRHVGVMVGWSSTPKTKTY